MTYIDDLMHSVFDCAALYRDTQEDVRCRTCGTRLKTYYAERMLYAVKCCRCNTITIVRAKNPSEAACLVGEDAKEDNHATD